MNGNTNIAYYYLILSLESVSVFPISNLQYNSNFKRKLNEVSIYIHMVVWEKIAKKKRNSKSFWQVASSFNSKRIEDTAHLPSYVQQNCNEGDNPL